jgi:hypothetical protein
MPSPGFSSEHRSTHTRSPMPTGVTLQASNGMAAAVLQSELTTSLGQTVTTLVEARQAWCHCVKLVSTGANCLFSGTEMHGSMASWKALNSFEHPHRKQHGIAVLGTCSSHVACVQWACIARVSPRVPQHVRVHG